jgi:putative spermidine/putrescine transport system permease protein
MSAPSIPARATTGAAPRRAGRSLHRASPYLLMSPVTVFYVVVLLIPFALVVATSFRTYEGAFTVGGFSGFSNYHEFLFGPGQRDVILRTGRIALLTTVLCVVIGYPTAYYTVRLSPRARSWVIMGLLAPLLTSVIARTFGWWTILGPGPVGNRLGSLMGHSDSLLFTETAIVIGMVNVLLPFMVIPLLAVMQNIDPNLRRAARSLGASPAQVLRHVDLPLTVQGLVGGIVIVLSLSMSAFIEPSLLGGSRNDVVATQIFRVGASYFNKPLSAAGSVLLSLAALTLVYLNLRFGGRGAARRLGMV